MLLKYKISTAILFSLLSFGVIAGESYTCELKAEKTKGWIPSTIEISFNDDRQVTKLYSANYDDYDIDKAKVIRYTKDFREIKYIGTYKTVKGANRTTIHTITILPKLNNKISYTMKFSHFSNHYTATGKCKRAELNQTKAKTQTQTKTTLTCPADIKMCSDEIVCARATTKAHSGVQWMSKSSLSYYEAKKRGLSCGVVSSNSKPSIEIETCSTNVNKCNKAQLCGRASYFTGSQHLWDKAKSSQKYVTEAKKRGLSCGVSTTAPAASEFTQDADLLSRYMQCTFSPMPLHLVKKNIELSIRILPLSKDLIPALSPLNKKHRAFILLVESNDERPTGDERKFLLQRLSKCDKLDMLSLHNKDLRVGFLKVRYLQEKLGADIDSNSLTYKEIGLREEKLGEEVGKLMLAKIMIPYLDKDELWKSFTQSWQQMKKPMLLLFSSKYGIEIGDN